MYSNFYDSVPELKDTYGKIVRAEMLRHPTFSSYTPTEKDKIAEDTKVKYKKETNKKLGRNDPCPCGSGKKFKICCGNRI